MQKLYDMPVLVIVSDLNYMGGERAIILTRLQYYKRKRFDGRYLTERCSTARFERVKMDEWTKEYRERIMKKYNVGPDYENNRWFMEQVRPTIY